MSVSELDGQVTVIRLTGRLDAIGADQIALRFTAASTSVGHDTIVDLADVTFMASMGMRLLVSTARALAQKGRRMVAFGAGELVLESLQDAAIDQVFPCVQNEAEALAVLRG